MSEKIQTQRKLSDSRIWDNLHISGNYRIDAHGRQDMLNEGIELLDKTLAQIESFSALSPETKREVVIQKKHWGRELSPEEETFAIDSGIIP